MLKEGDTYTLVGIRGKKVTNVEENRIYEGVSDKNNTFHVFIDGIKLERQKNGSTKEIRVNAYAYEEYHYDTKQGIDYGYKFYTNGDRDIPKEGDTIEASGRGRARSTTRRSGSTTRRSGSTNRKPRSHSRNGRSK